MRHSRKKTTVLLITTLILLTTLAIETSNIQNATAQHAITGLGNSSNVDLNYLALNLEEFGETQITTMGVVKFYASIFMFEDFWLQSKQNSSARILVVARFAGLTAPPADALVQVSGTIKYSNLEGGFFYLNASSIEEVKNIILIGWDGVQRNHLYELLDRQRLPNLLALMSNGAIVNITVTDHRTETKPGWTQILTGYRWWKTGVYSNTYWFNSIRAGYTIPERVEEYFGKDNVATAFISGKVGNMEIQNANGPYTSEAIFANLPSQVDVCDVEARNADAVGLLTLQFLENNSDNHFFAFFHFNDPDAAGHSQGEDSALYEEAIIHCDYWLGQIISKLDALKIAENTLVYVVSDHGLDEGGYSHANAPFVALATNDKHVKRNGDQVDIAPTVYYALGMLDCDFDPELDGYPLQLSLPQETEEKRQRVLADETQPSEPTISSPVNGAVICDLVNINFKASDKHLSAVLLLIDGKLKADDPWIWQGNETIETHGQYNWDTTGINPGAHTVTILAFDEHGSTNWPSSSTVGVFIGIKSPEPETPGQSTTPTLTPRPSGSPQNTPDSLVSSLLIAGSCTIMAATAAITGYAYSKRRKRLKQVSS